MTEEKKDKIADLLSKYCIMGSLDALADQTWNTPATKAMIEQARWFMKDQEVPSLRYLALMTNLIARETPKPVIFAIMASFVRLHQEIESLRSITKGGES